MEFLNIINLSKKYQGQQRNAIDDVSFKLKKGEVLAIVGENGSGKTTLLKLINGLEDADKGEISFEGDKLKGPSKNLVPGHQQIKMLFQEYNLFPKHTIKENITYNIRMYSDEDQEKILNGLLELCRLEGLENKLPAELSGGQQQRVALAKAVADEPRLLLMDEPFSNLDLFLKDEIKRKVIRRIKDEGNSAIFVTHDLKDALSLGDRIAVLKDGKLLQLDTPQNIYEKPSDKYIAYLFGKVNILDLDDFIAQFKIQDHKKFSKHPEKAKACIRPEHITLCKEDKSMTSGTITNVEYQGDAYELEIKTKRLALRVNTRKKKFKTGDKVYLKINPNKVHLIA